MKQLTTAAEVLAAFKRGERIEVWDQREWYEWRPYEGGDRADMWERMLAGGYRARIMEQTP